MSKLVQPNALAEEEMRFYIRQYEAETVGLGDRLLTEIQDVIDLISRYPSIGETIHRARVRGVIRRFPLRHFPFLLIYRERVSDIEVVALAHTSREPNYWRNRV